MSANPQAISDLLGPKFPTLTISESFDSWEKHFKHIAICNGVWGIYQGNDPILAKPVLTDFIPTAPNPKHGNAYGFSNNPGPKISDSEAPANYQYMIALYNLHLAEWKENDKLVRLALALLHAAIASSFWPNDVENDPRSAWLEIEQKGRSNIDFPGWYGHLDSRDSSAHSQ